MKFQSASSGIGVSPEVISSYQDMKNLKNCASLILHIECDEVRIKSKGDPLPENYTEEENKEIFEKLKAGLKDNEPRFIVFDFCFVSNGSSKRKLIFISW